MKLLDLYCGGGGAAVGYSRAGFDDITVAMLRKDAQKPLDREA